MKLKEQHNSRRDFLKKTAIGLSAFTVVPGYVLGGDRLIAADNCLTRTVILNGTEQIKEGGLWKSPVKDSSAVHLARPSKVLIGPLIQLKRKKIKTP